MGKYCYDYPRPAVAVDIAVLQWQQDGLKVLLIQRGNEPFAGQWALPGGFVEIDEPLEDAARRELREETGVADVPVKEFGTAGAPGRDPRGRTISILYYAIIPVDRSVQVQHGDDASNAQWFDMRSLPALAFDHAEVLRRLREHLRCGALYLLEGLEFLGEEVSLQQLQQVHEAILGQRVDAKALHKRLREWGVLEDAVPLQNRETISRVDRDRLAQIRREDLLASLLSDEVFPRVRPQ